VEVCFRQVETSQVLYRHAGYLLYNPKREDGGSKGWYLVCSEHEEVWDIIFFGVRSGMAKMTTTYNMDAYKEHQTAGAAGSTHGATVGMVIPAKRDAEGLLMKKESAGY
jgi:hypothetical protein